jgi:hypothetical protein
MRTVVFLLLALWVAGLQGQDTVYICPMDPDIRSAVPGVCSRCGMKLVAGAPDPVEYHMDLAVTPRAPKPNQKARLEFTVRNPWNNLRVTHFQPVHEELFHVFVVSQDLQFFVHDHPTFGSDGTFSFDISFPKPGTYRVLADFYPDGAMPQLIAETVIVRGVVPLPVVLDGDYSTKDAANLEVQLVTDPPQPVAGMKTMLLFRITPAEGLEKYLGAWGHMLAASDDLIDLIHTHPFLADGGPKIQFNMIFPRAHTYRIWVQFQRNGVLNTARFDVPVRVLQ